VGDIIGDLSSRRAQIQGTEAKGQFSIISCQGPLAEFRGYATNLRSISKGRASFYMEPSHYDDVPANIAEKLIDQKEKAAEGWQACVALYNWLIQGFCGPDLFVKEQIFLYNKK